MAQLSDSKLRGIPASWPNHTIERPTHLAIIAKENIDIDNLKDSAQSETKIPILEGAQDSKTETQRKDREARNKEVLKIYEKAEDKRIDEEKRKFESMRRFEADKKVRSILYLALDSE